MTSSRPVRSDAQRNRAHLLQVAGDLFAERGLDLTMGDLAAAAGLGTGTVYRHFGSKEELAVAAALARLEALVLELRGFVAGATGGPTSGARLRAQLEVLFSTLHRDRGLLDAVGDQLAGTALLADRRRALRGAVAELLKQAQRDGVVRRDVDVVDVVTLVGSVARPHAAAADPARHLAIAVDGLFTPDPSRLPERFPLPEA